MHIHHKSRNNLFFLFILAGLLNWSSNAEARAPKRQSIPEVQGFQLIWNDEFDGPTLDKNKWNYEVHGGPEGNNELQYYTDSPKNSYLQDGNFVIQAIKEPHEGKEYT